MILRISNVLALLVWLNIAGSVSGAQAAPAPPVADVNALFDRLGGLPAEYKADLGFSILSRFEKRLPDTRRTELLNQIFLAAPTAHYPNFSIYAAHNGDSIANAEIEDLYRERYDALDIQLRVVDAMLRVHPNVAATEFAAIKLQNSRASCTEPSVVSFSAYYKMTQRLAENTHIDMIAGTAKRLFFLGMIRDASDPEKFVPMLDFVDKTTWSEVEWQQIVSLLIYDFDHMQASDREITGFGSMMVESISALLNRLAAAHQPMEGILSAYRAFLVRSLTGAQCADKTADRVNLIKSFNALFDGKTAALAAAVRNLSLEEVQATSKGPSANDPSYSIDDSLYPHFLRLSEYKRARLLAQAGLGGPADQLDTSEDTSFILASSLRPSQYAGSCDLCDFGVRLAGFFYLTDNLPPGRDLQRATDAEIDFLSFNKGEDDYPIVYMEALKMLINVSRPIDPNSQGDLDKALTVFRNIVEAPSDDPQALRVELHRSKDRVIAAYMTYEDLFHPTYELAPQVAERVAKLADTLKPAAKPN